MIYKNYTDKNIKKTLNICLIVKIREYVLYKRKRKKQFMILKYLYINIVFTGYIVNIGNNIQ